MERAKTFPMSITPLDYKRWQTEPSIVIDPSLLSEMAPPPPSLGRRLAGVTLTTVRTVACAGVVGVTLFSVAHADKWLAKGHHSVHAAEAVTQHPVEPTPLVEDIEVRAEMPAPQALRAVNKPVPAEAVPAPQVERLEQAATEAAVESEQDEATEHAAEHEALRAALRSGRRALLQNRIDDSEAAYGSILSYRPRHPGALAGLARVGLARGDLDTAYKFAQQAVRFAPAHAVYHATLADVLRARGETAGADLEYEAAARLSRKPLDRAAKILPENPF